MKIGLIIETSQVIRRIASHLLLTEGYLAIDVATGSEGIDIATREQPVVVLVDSRIADIEPLQLIRLLRAVLPSQSKIFLTTVDSDPVIASQAIGAGAHAILVKPYDRFCLRELMSENTTNVAA